MLTLFVIPGSKAEKANFNRAAKSFGSYAEKVYVLSGVPFDTLEIETEWFGFIRSNEELSEGAREALPAFLSAGHFDYYSFYIQKPGGHDAEPRLFRRKIKLQRDAPYPENIEDYRGTFILDGYIIQQE